MDTTVPSSDAATSCLLVAHVARCFALHDDALPFSDRPLLGETPHLLTVTFRTQQVLEGNRHAPKDAAYRSGSCLYRSRGLQECRSQVASECEFASYLMAQFGQRSTLSLCIHKPPRTQIPNCHAHINFPFVDVVVHAAGVKAVVK